jgi:hypothetical protein
MHVDISSTLRTAADNLLKAIHYFCYRFIYFMKIKFINIIRYYFFTLFVFRFLFNVGFIIF